MSKLDEIRERARTAWKSTQEAGDDVDELLRVIEAAIAEVERAPHDEACAWVRAFRRWQDTDQRTPFEPADPCTCWRGRVLALLNGEPNA